MTEASEMEGSGLPALPLADWEQTKDTLHLYMQEIGKVQLATRSPSNHWWHVTFRPTARGLSTGILRWGATHFEIETNFIDHRVLVRTDRGEIEEIELEAGLAVAGFHRRLMEVLDRLGVRPDIRAEPFGVPMKTPFAEDHKHASYDVEYVERFWRILMWTTDVLEDFAGWFCGKQSPVHLFWHSLDLAHARYSGRRAPEQHDVDSVTKEAYSHEVIAFGFWAGSDQVQEPAYYSYTAPEPDHLSYEVLDPKVAEWRETGSGHLALLRYEDVRMAGDPRATLLSFFQSAYEAGARTAGWPIEDLESSSCPAEQRYTSMRGSAHA
jgi:hypothetical protein